MQPRAYHLGRRCLYTRDVRDFGPGGRDVWCAGVRALASITVVIAASSGLATAGTATLDNGLNDGQIQIKIDDYGSYGIGWTQNEADRFDPPGALAWNNPTWIAGAYLFVQAQGDASPTAVLLSNRTKWAELLDPSDSNGVVGPRALQRTIVDPNAVIGNTVASSRIRIFDASGVDIYVAIRNELTFDPAVPGVGVLTQRYTITNMGMQATLRLHAHWDTDLSFNGDWTNDVVGRAQGGCYIYAREPNSTTVAFAFGDGTASTATPTYYAGLDQVMPTAGPPVFTASNAALVNQHVWNSFGTPTSWRDHVAHVGTDVDGDSAAVGGGDAVMGLEYELQLASGAIGIAEVERHYGTSSPPCVLSSTCGTNNVVDPGEDCESQGIDTPDCNGQTCLFSSCGDGYTNTMDLEDCDSSGLDTDVCVGATCKTSKCGDGYVNPSDPAEECDVGTTDTTDCIAATCKASACGDFYVNALTEQCDDGPAGSDTCRDCLRPRCGDGVVDSGEGCDDGAADTEGCIAETCQPSTCGDGYVNAAASEECEPGESLCDASCHYTFSLGGGCAGCGAGGASAVAPWSIACAVLALRRRRSRRRHP